MRFQSMPSGQQLVTTDCVSISMTHGQDHYAIVDVGKPIDLVLDLAEFLLVR